MGHFFVFFSCQTKHLICKVCIIAYAGLCNYPGKCSYYKPFNTLHASAIIYLYAGNIVMTEKPKCDVKFNSMCICAQEIPWIIVCKLILLFWSIRKYNYICFHTKCHLLELIFISYLISFTFKSPLQLIIVWIDLYLFKSETNIDFSACYFFI